MMNCSTIRQRIGAWCDGEMAADERLEFQRHMESCAPCAQEWREHEELLARLTACDPAKDVSVPCETWGRIEAVLEVAPRTGPVKRISWRLFDRPLALAAGIALLVGLFSAFLNFSTAPAAEAASVDYTLLLDGLPGRVDDAISDFLDHYQAQSIPQAQAPTAAPALSYAVPADLPGGFSIEQAYRLKFGNAPGVAAVYRCMGEPLVAFFHPVLDDEHRGTYEEMPCIVGDRHGHEVQVGDWRLMHFMDRTTCHCILTTIDPESDILAQIVRRVAPAYEPSSVHHH